MSQCQQTPVFGTHAEQPHPGARSCTETQYTNQRQVGGWPRSFWTACGRDHLAAPLWLLAFPVHVRYFRRCTGKAFLIQSGLYEADFAAAPRGIRNARTAATRNSVGTSPQRWPLWSVCARACTPIMPACTTLDHTVNRMRLTWASGLRLASSRKTPSVA